MPDCQTRIAKSFRLSRSLLWAQLREYLLHELSD